MFHTQGQRQLDSWVLEMVAALPRVASVCAKIANQITLATCSPKKLFFLNYFSCGKNSVQVKKDRIRIFM